MSSSYTSLLGLVLPVTGELTDIWGGVVNSSLTQLVEDAIAGYATNDMASADWTLTDTAGGVDNQARKAILVAYGTTTPTAGVTRYINAPNRSKLYVVINNCASNSSVFLRAVTSTGYTTGVEIVAGGSALVSWDNTASDFVKIAGGSGGGATGGGNNQVFFQNDLTVTTSYSIPATKNAGTFGPVTVNSGVTVTVPSGSVWTVV
jgi:hypothetical protein